MSQKEQVPDRSPLEIAVDLAGGQSELERRIKALGRQVSQQSIGLWLKAGRLPEGKDWAIWIARAIDFQVTPHALDKAAYPNPWDGLPIEQARPLLEEARA